MTNVEESSVLITGGNKGLGLETAVGSASSAGRFLGSRDEGRGQAAADKLAAKMHELAYSSSKAALNMIAVRPTGTFIDRLSPVAW